VIPITHPNQWAGIADLKDEFLIESLTGRGSQSKIHPWVMQRQWLPSEI